MAANQDAATPRKQGSISFLKKRNKKLLSLRVNVFWFFFSK
jgi:hypothetical protein